MSVLSRLHRRIACGFAVLVETTRRRAQAFATDVSGNIAVILTVAAPAMVMMVGVTVEFARVEHARGKLQQAVDSASLALAKYGDTYDDVGAAAERYVKASLEGLDIDHSSLTVTANVVSTLNSKSATISASVSTPLYFTQLFTRDKTEVSASSQSMESYQNIEIALVLDVSSSMRGNKIEELRKAAIDFVEILLESENDQEYTTITIVPYGGTVNGGSQFNQFVLPGVDHLFAGCVELRAQDMLGGVLPLGLLEVVPDFTVWNAGNPWCPKASNEVLYFENDPTVLTQYINGLTELSDGTGSDIGAAFGLKMLMPEWRGRVTGAQTKAPRDFSQDVIKVLVVMTDGGITAQYRPTNFFDGYAKPNGDYVDYNRNTASTYFSNVCKEAKEKHAIVTYTIGFNVNQNWMLDLLKDCASGPANYFETDNTGIAEAFETIAYRLTPLRLVN